MPISPGISITSSGGDAERLARSCARRSSGASTVMVSWITSPRRRRFSAVSNSRTRSSASSSTSRSLSRSTRKAQWPSMRVAGEELAEEDLEQRLERQEADLPLRPVRQPHEARHLRRHRQQRLEHGVVGLAPELQPHGEAAVGDERERDAPGRWRAATGSGRPARRSASPSASGRRRAGRPARGSRCPPRASAARSTTGTPAGASSAPARRRRSAAAARPATARRRSGCARPRGSARAGRRRAPSRTRRGSRPRSTGSAPARAAARSGSPPRPSPAS